MFFRVFVYKVYERRIVYYLWWGGVGWVSCGCNSIYKWIVAMVLCVNT